MDNLLGKLQPLLSCFGMTVLPIQSAVGAVTGTGHEAISSLVMAVTFNCGAVSLGLLVIF